MREIVFTTDLQIGRIARVLVSTFRDVAWRADSMIVTLSQNHISPTIETEIIDAGGANGFLDAAKQHTEAIMAAVRKAVHA